MRSVSYRRQAGFTLIELVIVIVIIGILAAVAIPKYIDLKTEAAKSALDAVAGSLAAASSTNSAVSGIPGKAVTVSTCADIGTNLVSSFDTTTYSITTTTLVTAAAGGTDCVVTSNALTTANTRTFKGYKV